MFYFEEERRAIFLRVCGGSVVVGVSVSSGEVYRVVRIDLAGARENTRTVRLRIERRFFRGSGREEVGSFFCVFFAWYIF